MDQKSSQKDARTMWNATSAASTTPAIQCVITHSNFQPRIGRKPVPNRVSTAAAIVQW
jgi:hypothetical protein